MRGKQNSTTGRPSGWNTLIKRVRLVVCLLLASLLAAASNNAGGDPPYEEIHISVSVQRVGGVEIPALIYEQEVYLPVADVFQFLKIKNSLSADLDSATGFFIHPTATYLIDKNTSTITYNGQLFELKPDDLIRTETNLFLKLEYFGKIFGIEGTFNFRSLSVLMDTRHDLPVFAEMRQEMMRRNIKKLKGDIKADTVIGRSFSLFRLGMADWTLWGTQEEGGVTEARMNLRLGALIAGGEATASLKYNSRTPVDARQQFLQWRYVNNKLKALRQVTLGTIAPQTLSTIFAPVVGVQVSNTPTLQRQSFGTYTLSNRTEPNWIVELYINNVLVDYVRADAAGFYTFHIPLVYGLNTVSLRFYGPSGEERSSEQNINIPFSFLPKGHFQYTVNAGLVRDAVNTRFSRAQFTYGLGRMMTVGGGLEYLSSVGTHRSIPFLNATIRATSSILVSAEYAQDVRSKAAVSYRHPSNLQVELNYVKYTPGQRVINNNFLEERKAVLSLPVRMGKAFFFTRLAVNQIVTPLSTHASTLSGRYKDLPKQRFTSGEFLISGAVSRFSGNLATNALFSTSERPAIFSNLTLTYRSAYGFVFRPGAQFDFSKNRFMTAKFEMEKSIGGKGFVNLFYEKDFRTNNHNISLGLRYDLSFARTSVLVHRTNNKTTFIQSATGSMMVDAATNYAVAGNRIAVGRGGITVVPFLDLNGNGKRDAEEPEAQGLGIRINGGRIIQKKGSNIIRVSDLEPNNDYLLQLDGSGFENISWQLKQKTMSITVDPNVFKLVEVPVAVLGEVSGTVYLTQKNERKGVARIRIHIYDSHDRLVAQTLTEADGFFSYLGLTPGSYTATVDSQQLQKLQLTALPATLPFTVESSVEGFVAGDMTFVLQPAPAAGNK